MCAWYELIWILLQYFDFWKRVGFLLCDVSAHIQPRGGKTLKCAFSAAVEATKRFFPKNPAAGFRYVHV